MFLIRTAFQPIWNFAQRINASVQPQWPLNGIPLTITAGNQLFYQIIADAAHGFIAEWEDENCTPGHAISGLSDLLQICQKNLIEN